MKRVRKERGENSRRHVDRPDRDVRLLALEALMEINEKGTFAHYVTSALLEKYSYLSHRDRDLLLRLVTGTVERRLTLDARIDRIASTPVNRQRPLIRNLLRMGVYQIDYMDRIPDSAACNETVRLCKKKGAAGLSSFVNGVLRTAARTKEAHDERYEAQEADAWAKIGQDVRQGSDAGAWLSAAYSIPQWIISRWSKELGAETTRSILASFYQERPLTIRLNEAVASQEDLERELASEGARLTPHPFGGEAFELDGFSQLTSLLAFQKGMFAIQDASSMLAVRAAGLTGTEQVLDLCAAPGGKTCHAAQLLTDGGHVTACDVSERKLERIRENIRRLHLEERVRVCLGDALVSDPMKKEAYDVVLADLPCSGLGVLGKKVDLKYRLRPEEIPALCEMQRKMLDIASAYVKPGGRLVYSTCTVSSMENTENALRFIKEHPDFAPADVRSLMPPSLDKARVGEGGYAWQMLPGVHPCDGFFIAVFEHRQAIPEENRR